MNYLSKRQIKISFIIANILTQFLFFIDEGWYDFRWMKSWGNWVVYLIYILLIWGLSLLLQVLFNMAVRFYKKMTVQN